jgi:hypothetical protein
MGKRMLLLHVYERYTKCNLAQMQRKVQVHPELMISVVKHDFLIEILKVVKEKPEDYHYSHEVGYAEDNLVSQVTLV